MKEFINGIRENKISKKHIIILCIGAAAILLLLSGSFSDTDDSETSSSQNFVSSADYIKKSEKNLENLLSEIDGAGKVQVMLTVESCYENVYARSYDSKAENSQNGAQSELTEDYVIVKKGSNNEECLVVKVYEPTVKGVAVIAEGADSIKVKTAITDTVCALFDISTAQVSVEKMCADK